MVGHASLESSDVEISFYGHAAIVRCVQRSHSTRRGQPMALTVSVWHGNRPQVSWT
jgi:hypothetical protein